MLAAAVVSVIGCAPQSYVVRSDHFTLTMRRGWEVVNDARSSRATVIVSVPAGESAGGRAGPELFIYPWLARDRIAQPTEEALKRLAADDELGLRAALPPDRDRCGMLPDRLSLLGGPQIAVHLETAAAHLIVVAGQAQGSLVAVVGVVSTAASYCPDLAVMVEAMQTLGTTLVGADRSDLPPPQPPSIAPLPPYPVPVLPSPRWP